MRGAETVKGGRSGKNYLPSGGRSFSDRAVPVAEQGTSHLAGQEALFQNHWCQMGFLSSAVTPGYSLMSFI